MTPRSPARLASLAATAAITASTAGCPNVANLTTARVLDPGTVEVTLAPAVTGMSLAIFDSAETGALTAGTLDMGVRVGVAESVDLGARISNMGNMNLDVKVGLLDTESLRVALDPTIGAVFIGGGEVSAGYMQLDLPVLVDIPLGERFTFSLAPRYTLLYFFAEGSTSPAAHLLGGAVGFEIALGDTFALQPNAGVAYWVNGPEDADSMFFSVGVAFKFLIGGKRVAEPEAATR